MSRRKPAPPTLQPGGSRTFTTKVICSDRGQHSPPVVLHHIYDARGLDLGHAVADVGGRNAAPLSPWREDGTVHYRFCCPRCGRDVPMREETLLRILESFSEIAQTRHPVLDISSYNGR